MSNKAREVDLSHSEQQYRLITRSDFDGLVCATLIKLKLPIAEVKFVHPKDMQDGLIEVTQFDVCANLPYVPGVHLAFDHHASELTRVGSQHNHIIDPDAPSAARVIYNYYGGAAGFPAISDDLMEAVDKGDSANFSLDDVLHPRGWVLLNFLMDARTGLGRFKDFRISNYQLMMDLIEYCQNHSIDQILAVADIKERIDLYMEHQPAFKDQIAQNAALHGPVLVVDLRHEDLIYAGNRFVKYALFPQCNISIQVMWGFKKQNTVFTVGKSIFERSSSVHIGNLMLSYGGGGHVAAGTCQVDNADANAVLQEIIHKIRQA